MLMSNRNKVAKLYYMPNGFRPLSSGDHVLCAITSEQIPLEDLRYWSVEKQEPYASAQISAQAHLPEEEK
ncbi:DUF2093 domain-containing protein [Parasphingorhabdus cellanae]|uniref:DUF2093 domain-containing protein n=1 Tax=Parasphingorhabdus cellanae TaxID=2806553 RepID=A0ABX7T7Y9_9SPHN|nr:DUF2093 domain-containing protein [Parasphingorhabdus cellanae]QTD56975.1 DUF2093 domain-containing protein [Parasphingorhabdus cellanae]